MLGNKEENPSCSKVGVEIDKDLLEEILHLLRVKSLVRIEKRIQRVEIDNRIRTCSRETSKPNCEKLRRRRRDANNRGLVYIKKLLDHQVFLKTWWIGWKYL
ncbi:unnamed protein product [Cochlearia groenlandica]